MGSDDGVRCMLMRGGTSKGAYFLAEDLPADPAERDDLLLRIMGSPDPRQIDGIGGAHPLTSKVAVISRSARAHATSITCSCRWASRQPPSLTGRTAATCWPASDRSRWSVDWRPRRRSGSTWSTPAASATAAFPGADGVVDYDGRDRDRRRARDGGGGGARLRGTQGSATGALLPTGNISDVIDGIPVTCVDNGMPVVVVAASISAGPGTRRWLTWRRMPNWAPGCRRCGWRGRRWAWATCPAPRCRRSRCVAAPADGGTICTRTFIPVRVHESIGVLGAVSVATALLLDGAAGADLAAVTPGQARFDIEHPSGHLEVEVEIDTNPKSGQPPAVIRAGVVRTARKLFDGTVFPRRH